MSLPKYLRTVALLCLVMAAVAVAQAQHGGGPGGGGPGGGPGGGMGGGMGVPGGGMMGGPREADRERLTAHLQSQPIRSEPQITLPGRWWDDRKTVKSLNLRNDQQQRMDDIFNASKGNLISLYENLQREQQRFVSMSREDLQDETKVFAEIDRVAQARAELEKANFHILLQIRKEMDPEQLAALDHQIASAQ